MAKSYQLVAWTERGEVRMVPSLLEALSLPYRERIAAIEAQWEHVEDETGWLYAQSKAHEAFARFLLRAGRPREAYTEYENAARVCTYCSDGLWLQGEACDFPILPLLYRFLSMHRECIKLALKDAFLRHLYEGSVLESDYLFFTTDDRITERECNDSYASMKAWAFGKGEGWKRIRGSGWISRG